MTKEELIEKLAEIEHTRWSKWQKWVHQNTITLKLGNTKTPRDVGYHAIPDETINHWDRLIATDYADLPEHNKESDRREVMEYWPVIVEFVADWLGNVNCTEYEDDVQCQCSYAADDWRKEMTSPPSDPGDRTR